MNNDFIVLKGFKLFNTFFWVGDWVYITRFEMSIPVEGVLEEVTSYFIAVRNEKGKLYRIKRFEIEHMGFSTEFTKKTLENRKILGI